MSSKSLDRSAWTRLVGVRQASPKATAAPAPKPTAPKPNRRKAAPPVAQAPGAIIGMDPGVSTGLATYSGGQLKALETIEPHAIRELLLERKPARVIFEDSRLQSHTWNAQRQKSRAAVAAVGRSLGHVDQICRQIVSICEELGIPAHGISPAVKGAKLDADQFEVRTGWGRRSNQHERDAAMVAWPFRGAARGQ